MHEKWIIFNHLQNSAFSLVKMNDLTAYKQVSEQNFSQFVEIQYCIYFPLRLSKSPSTR